MFSEVAMAAVEHYGKSFQDFIGFLFSDYAELLAHEYPVLREPRTTFFIKIVSVFYLLTSNNYWITSIYFSLISFLGSWILTNELVKHNRRLKIPAVLALFYFPEFVFWTSGILKESIAWFCLAVLISYIFAYSQKKKIIL